MGLYGQAINYKIKRNNPYRQKLITPAKTTQERKSLQLGGLVEDVENLKPVVVINTRGAMPLRKEVEVSIK